MFRGHYDNWIQSRMNGLLKYIPTTYFKNKTLLEVGGGHGHIGNEFYKLGADVTTSDGRQEHIDVVKSIYPSLKTLYINGENDDIPTKYDIILHWGLLYHLSEIDTHLQKISEKCDVLLLETEVCDSDDSFFYFNVNESGYDQALSNKGIRPSPSYVERILSTNGFQYKLIKDPILNSDFHIYDWDIQNTKRAPSGLRRFWICWKNVESPL